MSKANYQFNHCTAREQLELVLSQELVGELKKAIKQKGQAVIAFSGGSTPIGLFNQLSSQYANVLDWSKVLITLVDERWVDTHHALSNQALLEKHLTVCSKIAALYFSAPSVEDSLASVLKNYAQLTASESVDLEGIQHFDVAVLGMGGDGHTASFFPDADNISELLDLNGDEALLTCYSASTQVERVTWSLPMLLKSKHLFLHITGSDKRAVFEQALKGGDVHELPIRSVLFQDKTKLSVFYAD